MKSLDSKSKQRQRKISTPLGGDVSEEVRKDIIGSNSIVKRKLDSL